MMLQDPEIEAKVDVKISRVLKNVEWVLQEVVDELVAKLATVQDAYLKERTLDIRDVSGGYSTSCCKAAEAGEPSPT